MQQYLFHNQKLLLTDSNSVPCDVAICGDSYEFTLGDCEECVAAETESIPAGLKAVGLRDSYDLLPLDQYLKAGKAAELLYWHANHRYCGICGAELRTTSSISKVCTGCDAEIWPKLAPAVIVLIYDGDRILLVRSKVFRGNYYGLVAGFVEFGESLEEAVVREIKEETQLEVDSVRYFGSQPWPYPQGLMLGFTARYKGGEICLQEAELCAGEWFDIHNLPDIPKPLSMARKLIDDYIDKKSEFNSIQ